MIFHGNELTYGLVISFWLFGGGIGALLGRKINEEKLYLSFLFLSLYFPFSIFLLRFLPTLLGVKSGEILSYFLLIKILFLLMPLYLGFGLIFALGQKKISRLAQGELRGITRPYIFAAIGDLLGGIIFSYVFVLSFSPTRKLILVSALFLIPVILLKGRRFIPLFLIFLLFFAFTGIEGTLKRTTEKFYFGFKVREIIETKYGRYIELQKDDQISFFSNGVLSYTFPDELTAEFIHLPILLSPSEKENILYLGLPSPEVIKQLSKYKEITIVYPDTKIIDFLSKYLNKELLRRVNFIASDPRLFLKNTSEKFDGIFLGMGDPLSISGNRFYTFEFAKLLSNRMEEDGVVSFLISSGEDYLSESVLDYNSLIFWTYKSYFPYYYFIPGLTLRLVFSKSPLYYEEKRIKEKVKKLGLFYLDEYIILSSLPPLRIREIEKKLNNNFIGFNTDNRPKAFLLSLLLHLEKQNQRLKILKNLFDTPFIFILFFIPIPILLKKTGFRVSIIGAFSFGISYFCVLILQIKYGNLYYLVGLITGSFMFGIGIGTYLSERLKLEDKLKKPFLFLSILLSFQYLLIEIEFFMPSILVLIPIISFSAGMVVGWTYTNAGVIFEKKGVRAPAPLVYALDLIGGCIGAFLFSFIFLPVIGIIPTLLLSLGICIFGYLFA